MNHMGIGLNQGLMVSVGVYELSLTRIHGLKVDVFDVQ